MSLFVLFRVAIAPKASTSWHGKGAERGNYPEVHLALEGHDEVGDLGKRHPLPLSELGLVAGCRINVDLALLAEEADREPLLILSDVAPAPGLADEVRRQVVAQPTACLTEDFYRAYAALLDQLAKCRIGRIFVGVDAALRHLPPLAAPLFLTGSVGAAPDPHEPAHVDHRDADAGAISGGRMAHGGFPGALRVVGNEDGRRSGAHL